MSNVNENGSETVLHYGARATTKAERSYSATDLELAALLTGIRTYHSYLANTKFEVLSDHVSLTYIRNLKFGPSRLVRASIQLSQYDFVIRHIRGQANTAADSLSRIPNIKADDLTVQQAEQFKGDDDDFLFSTVSSHKHEDDDDGDKANGQFVDGHTKAKVACNVSSVAYAVNNALSCNNNVACVPNVVRLTNDVCCATNDDDFVCLTKDVCCGPDDDRGTKNDVGLTDWQQLDGRQTDCRQIRERQTDDNSRTDEQMEQGTDDTICDRSTQDDGDLQTLFVAAMTKRTKGTEKEMQRRRQENTSGGAKL